MRTNRKTKGSAEMDGEEEVRPEWACPKCGEKRMDYLTNVDGHITCACGHGYDIGEVSIMDRDDEILKLIESKAKEILRANGHKPEGVEGRIGDGCEIVGEPLWVFWPLSDGSDCVAIYAYTVMFEDHEIHEYEQGTEDDLITLDGLVPGYRDMQRFIEQVEERIR